MAAFKDLIQTTAHRPWPLPQAAWSWYQEWNHAVFLHWKVPPEVLAGLVPTGVTIDLYNDDAWVSLVAFTMDKLRPRLLPSLSAISTFDEINIRTYVTRDGKPGVFFINIEGGKLLSCIIANRLSGLPYEAAMITRSHSAGLHRYTSVNSAKGFNLDAVFSVGKAFDNRSDLDKWLIERYCLYLQAGSLYRYETHHKEWGLHELLLKNLQVHYTIGDLSINTPPDLAHYSEGVKVIAWNRERLS